VLLHRSSLHEATIQCLVNVLDFEMSVREAVLAPQFMGPLWLPVRERKSGHRARRRLHTTRQRLTQAAEPGHFARRVLAEFGRSGRA
jgi:hypothetical protein